MTFKRSDFIVMRLLKENFGALHRLKKRWGKVYLHPTLNMNTVCWKRANKGGRCNNYPLYFFFFFFESLFDFRGVFCNLLIFSSTHSSARNTEFLSLSIQTLVLWPDFEYDSVPIYFYNSSLCTTMLIFSIEPNGSSHSQWA